MNCEHIQKELSAFISNDIEDTARSEIQSHLNACPDCSRVYREIKRLSEVLQSWKGIEPSPMMCEKLKRRIATRGSGWWSVFSASFAGKAAIRLAEIVMVVAATLLISQQLQKPAPQRQLEPAPINFYLTEHQEAIARTVPAELTTPPAIGIPIDREDLLYYEFLDDLPETRRPGVILRGRAAREDISPAPAASDSKEQVLSLDQARESANFPLVAPTRIHPGYILDSVRKIEGRNCLHLLYTNGINTLSLFEQPANGERGLAVQDFRQYAVYRMEEPAPEPARVTILAWTRGEMALVLIGKANLTQLMDIGQEINEAAGIKQAEAHAPAPQL
jgi:hypothetical protein